MGKGTTGDLSIKRGDMELSGDWLRPTLISVGVVLCVALVYQLLVGGVKVELTGGRLIIDAGGLTYWWQLVTHR